LSLADLLLCHSAWLEVMQFHGLTLCMIFTQFWNIDIPFFVHHPIDLLNTKTDWGRWWPTYDYYEFRSKPILRAYSIESGQLSIWSGLSIAFYNCLCTSSIIAVKNYGYNKWNGIGNLEREHYLISYLIKCHISVQLV